MIGKTVSHYRILEELGRGGMGIVYKAEDIKLKRMVALKFLTSRALGDEEQKARFFREAQAAAALDHPNICTIYEIDEANTETFIAMAYCHGKSLKEKIESGQMRLYQVLGIATQVAEGLKQAHEKGIVHRDIKSANIIVTETGEAKIMDFGVAKLEESVSVTDERTTVGTAAYMSPEQALGETVDHRTDIWSLGIVLYEMVTGQPPFRGEYEQAVIYSILNENPEPLSDLRSGISSELERIVNKCLAKHRNERYQNIYEVLTDLNRLKEGLESRDSRQPYFEAKLPVSVAVLPFEDLSPRQDQEYFCDGITEELINALTSLKGLRVVSRTSAFAFKAKPRDVREIGRQLNVTAVLEGSVRKAGRKLRITAQLVDSDEGLHLWSETYERKAKDIFAIQDDISRAIVHSFKTDLTDELETLLSRSPPKNLDAYHLYLKGRFYWNKRTEEGVKKGIDYFEKALEKDPFYAQAYAGLADSYIILGIYSTLPPREVMPKGEEAALKALEIDSALAEAHTSLGCFKSVYDWDWSGAEEAFRRAIKLNPSYATAHHWYAINLLTPQERFDEAMVEIKRAHELDPLSLVINTTVGLQFFFARKYTKSVEQYHKTLEIDPSFGVARLFLGQAYNQESRYKEAVVEIERAINLYGATTNRIWGVGKPDAATAKRQKAKAALGDLKKFIPHFGKVMFPYRSSTNMLATLGYTYAVSGKTVKAKKILQELIKLSKQRYVSSYDIAAVHTGLGEKDQAFEWLEKAVEERSYLLIYLKIDPILDALRSDSRFSTLLEKIGLPE